MSQGQGQYIGSLNTPSSAVFTWDNEIKASISAVTTMDWHVQLIHAVSVTQAQQYTICFSAKAEAGRMIGVNIDQGGTPGYDSVITEGAYNPLLSTSYQDYKYTFTASTTDTSARLTFNLGLSDVDVYLDNLGVYPGAQCGDPSKTPAPATGTGSDNIVGTPPITTQGNQVLFGGKTGSIAGMSLFWSNYLLEGGKFYTAGVVQTLKNEWNAKLVRAAMGVDVADGYLTDPSSNMNRVKTIVDSAIANDMYVIIDWHTHNAEDHKPQAIAFFQDMARTYGDKNNVIYEIYNEPDCPTTVAANECSWDTKTSWSTIKSYAVDVIAAIRAIDPDNLIIVGTPYYSQFVDEASEDPISGINIAYTLHFYAATHKERERSRARVALRNGIPLFVTEWGTVEADGNGAVDVVESDTWMDFLYDNNISHANWSVSDKAEGASILKPGTNGENGGWTDGDLTESGQYVRSQIMGW
jgi:hypothetical protein